MPQVTDEARTVSYLIQRLYVDRWVDASSPYPTLPGAERRRETMWCHQRDVPLRIVRRQTHVIDTILSADPT